MNRLRSRAAWQKEDNHEENDGAAACLPAVPVRRGGDGGGAGDAEYI